jgi:excisionase family DNA binding protein
MTQTQTLYRLPTAAAILAVEQRTLKRWHEQGKIRLVELPGGHYRVPGEEITRLLQNTAPTERIIEATDLPY